MFAAAVAAADPARCVPPHLPPPPAGRTLVVGAGKAAAPMALATEAHWPADRPLSGLVVHPYGHGIAGASRIEAMEAGHPLPDAAGQAAAARLLQAAAGLGPDDLVLGLFSGGGSALLPRPAPGIRLEEKQAVTRTLLRCGAAIGEINVVRKHLSGIKGGRLAAAAWPAAVVSLLISDVPGDDPSRIASGPTVPDPSTSAEAAAVLARYGIALSAGARAWLESPASETPKPGDPRLARTRSVVVASAQTAREAAEAVALQAGVAVVRLGDAVEGEAREVARAMAGIAASCARHRGPAPPPCVLLSGGETSVTVRGHGAGGRNTEFLLALAIALDGHPGIFALAADTDGIDGTGDNAGAVLAPNQLARAAALGVDARARLAENDARNFFAALGDLVVTGPTRTNVNDFRAILVLPAC